MLIRRSFVQRLLLLIAIPALFAGCASQGPSIAGETPAVTPPQEATPRHAPATGDRVADIALAMVGKPYRFGGDTPHGFDCSGLVRYAYDQVGITVPRTSRAQREAARNVRVSSVRRGDLLFFDTSWKFGHVGIYVGEGRFVHAPSSGKRVAVVPLNEGYFASRLEAVGRLNP